MRESERERERERGRERVNFNMFRLRRRYIMIFKIETTFLKIENNVFRDGSNV